MIDTDDYVMLSALQHFAFCPRQCALIHLEQAWSENIYTLRGLRVHEQVNQPGDELMEEGIRVERALPLYSHRLKLKGIADAVEFLADGTIYPVEYKSGNRKEKLPDEIQLCAQALCLEEMLNCSIPKGALFYHGSRRRREVGLDESLRNLTIQAVADTRQMLQSQRLPAPVNDQRCPNCSLLETCMPEAVSQFSRVTRKNNPFGLEGL